MTIKESNEQINKRLDLFWNSFKDYKSESREDRKNQEDFNKKILEKVTKNSADNKNNKEAKNNRRAVIIAATATVLSCVGIAINFIK
jgi:hypothetical protein